jgi:hypothetical protein
LFARASGCSNARRSSCERGRLLLAWCIPPFSPEVVRLGVSCSLASFARLLKFLPWN